ncbi:MAG: hypothetical protein LKJ21_07905 [Oscillospiraceae bacterium]|nr:hypothetical protein [Oscillospiraceae bacterium]MCI1991329.1 hypothetical protein [Oscillospiraceae bacterium]MCI2035117.1 hypothetical protein [Oscillospiraceae bacterium]
MAHRERGIRLIGITNRFSFPFPGKSFLAEGKDCPSEKDAEGVHDEVVNIGDPPVEQLAEFNASGKQETRADRSPDGSVLLPEKRQKEAERQKEDDICHFLKGRHL